MLNRSDIEVALAHAMRAMPVMSGQGESYERHCRYLLGLLRDVQQFRSLTADEMREFVELQRWHSLETIT